MRNRNVLSRPSAGILALALFFASQDVSLAKVTAAKSIMDLISSGDHLYIDVGEANDCNLPNDSPYRNRFFLKIDGKPSTTLQASMLITAKTQDKQVKISGGGLGSCEAEHGEKMNFIELK